MPPRVVAIAEVQGEEALQTADEIALNRVDAAFCRLPRTRRYSDRSPAGVIN